jgi:hypothetical protein
LLSYINSPLISNRDVSICDLWEFILQQFTFTFKYVIIFLIKSVLWDNVYGIINA